MNKKFDEIKDLLEKLLKGELRQRRKINMVQEKKFSDMLNSVLIRYRNRGMDTLQVIEDLMVFPL